MANYKHQSIDKTQEILILLKTAYCPRKHLALATITLTICPTNNSHGLPSISLWLRGFKKTKRLPVHFIAKHC